MDIKVKNNLKREESKIGGTFKTYLSKKFIKSHEAFKKQAIKL